MDAWTPGATLESFSLPPLLGSSNLDSCPQTMYGQRSTVDYHSVIIELLDCMHQFINFSSQATSRNFPAAGYKRRSLPLEMELQVASDTDVRGRI